MDYFSQTEVSKSLIYSYYPDLILIVDKSYSILEYLGNPAIFYTEPDNLHGKKLNDLYNIENYTLLKKSINKVLSKKSSEYIEYSLELNSIKKVYSCDISPADNNVIINLKEITSNKRAQEAIGKSETRFRSVWENSLDGMCLTDFHGNIVAVNKAFCILFEYSAEELVGFPFNDVLGLNNNKRSRIEELENIKFNKFNNCYEISVFTKSKKLLFLEVSNTLVDTFEDEIIIEEIVLLSIFKNITDKKLAEQVLKKSEEKFRSVWANSSEGMRLTNSEGIIVAVNESYCKLAQFSEDQLIGKTFNSIYTFLETSYNHSLDLENYKKNFQQNSFPHLGQMQIRFTSGLVKTLDITYSIIEFSLGEPLLLTIFHDITERKETEKKLQENDKLAAIGKMAAYLSHEIKTPLASISLNIEMLLKDLVVPENKLKSFNIISREIKRLNKLLKNVLLYSRQSNLNYVDVNMFDVASSIKQIFEPLIIKKNITYINNLNNLIIKCDFHRVQTVLQHLIENCIDACENDGHIQLYYNETDKEFNIFIKDDGLGVLDPYSIFEPFFTTKHSGTGLGLAIVQKIMELHEGKISLLTSVPGETIFQLTFKKNIYE